MENPYTMPYPQTPQQPQGQKPLPPGQGQNTPQPGQQPPKKKIDPKMVFAFIFLIAAGALTAKVTMDSMAPRKQPSSLSESYAAAKKGAATRSSKNAAQRKGQQTKAQPLIAFKKKVQEPSEPFVLSGIYFEGETPFALVNDKVVQEGDTVDKALVQKITMEGVELKTEDKIIRLTTRGR